MSGTPNLRIYYESDGFPAGAPVTNGWRTLETSWDDVLWAAVTVGRPNRQYVFKNDMASEYEALFRFSLVRMTLEQSGQAAYRLRRTSAARTLDPSEKGAINYFLGLAICKLFAAKLLNAPWLLHLDVFRPQLNPVLRGRSRPDLVGQTTGGSWVALECKGRLSAPNERAKQSAKAQARRLISVSGSTPAYHVGGIAYFKNDILQFFWRDPEPGQDGIANPVSLNVTPVDWRHYYEPSLGLIRSRPADFERMQREPFLMPVESADLQIGIQPAVLRLLAESRWKDAHDIRSREHQTLPDVSRAQSPYQIDGIAVIAGPSWHVPFREP